MTSIAFIIISLLSLLLLYLGVGKNKRLLLLFISWQFIVGFLAFFMVLETHPKLFPILILGSFTLTIYSLKQIDIKIINPRILLAIHILRIPVELVLYQLFLLQKIPNLMTFKGWNFDILVGISALAISIYQIYTKSNINRQFFMIWNIIGIIFLFIIALIGILSSPLPIQQFAFEQPNIAVLEFPYCFLPTCVVQIVLISHILLLKWSFKQKS